MTKSEQRVKANGEGKCAGCGVIFELDKEVTPEPLMYDDYYWCTDCYQRRLKGIRRWGLDETYIQRR